MSFEQPSGTGRLLAVRRGVQFLVMPQRRRSMSLFRSGQISRAGYRCLLFGLVLWSAAASLQAAGPASLSSYYDRWLVGVEPMMLAAEKERFATLQSDLEREWFIYHFWRIRGEGSGSDRGWLADWRPRLDTARRLFDDPRSDRARTMVLVGRPERISVYGGCRGQIRPMRIWFYNAQQASWLSGEPKGEGFYLVFVHDLKLEHGVFRQWSPELGMAPLLEREVSSSNRTIEQILDFSTEFRCFRTGPKEGKILAGALATAETLTKVEQWVQRRFPNNAWLAEFDTALAAGTLAPLPAEPVVIEPMGTDGRKTIVRGRIELATRWVRRNGGGQLFDRFVLRGEVLYAQRAFDRFEQVFHLAGAAPPGERISLDFYRRLRPGMYTLRLRLEDALGLALARQDIPLDVPVMEKIAVDPPGRRMGLSGLTRREVVTLITFPSLELLPPGDHLAGSVEIEAVTTGGPIAAVEFTLDGQPVGKDDEPPYSARVDLGAEPARHELRAVALDPDGRELVSDQLSLAPGPRPFAVRLLTPQPGAEAPELAEAEVVMPPDRRLEQVELYWRDQRFAVLREPPFRHALPTLRSGSGFVRVVAELESGERVEDLVFVGKAPPIESMNVRLKEVYTAVLDSRGRPVSGLEASNFRLLEDGQPQRIERFDVALNLPISVVLMMDVSVSMRRRLNIAVESARRFFTTVVTPKDNAALITFNHDIRLDVPFTADVERLRLGASGLTPWGGTRLNDSLVYASCYFAGQEGRRALVLLSDGRDVESDFRFEQVREHALRAGVAVYPILLAVDDKETRSSLGQLAEESGGRLFSIRRAAELDRVYRSIEEELRSQYLLVYHSDQTRQRKAFRRIDVEVDRPGLRTRSIRGYYP